MEDKFIRCGFDKVFNVEKLISVFYMEFSKHFRFEGESHDFWEMAYIDKGEMICTADKKEFVLKSGELVFHKPNEFHAIRSGENSAPNLSVITFECKSRAMKQFEGKIYPLTSEERALLSLLFREGLHERLRDDIVGYFYNMAKRTGTLWENDTEVASCNHGFASHVLLWLDGIAEK